jgi:hypothetical protein
MKGFYGMFISKNTGLNNAEEVIKGDVTTNSKTRN